MGRKKLSEIQEAEIRDYLKNGHQMSKIAQKYHVSVEVIERINEQSKEKIPDRQRKTLDLKTRMILKEWDDVRIWFLKRARAYDSDRKEGEKSSDT